MKSKRMAAIALTLAAIAGSANANPASVAVRVAKELLKPTDTVSERQEREHLRAEREARDKDVMDRATGKECRDTIKEAPERSSKKD